MDNCCKGWGDIKWHKHKLVSLIKRLSETLPMDSLILFCV